MARSKADSTPPQGQAQWHTPIGPIHGRFTRRGWTTLALPGPDRAMLPDQSESKRFSVALKGVRPIAGQATASKTLVASMTRFLAQYFAGQAPSEAPCLDLDGVAPFQADVLRALRATPHGRIVTYGQLARLAGRPGAARAVGQAMARNPLPLAIPCHRVLAGAMGMPRRLGGFGPGLPLKCWLLRWEGHASWIEEPTRAGAQVGEPRQGRRRDNLG